MKIELNKQLDKEVYTAFCEAVVGGVDFGKKIRNDHPGITKENYNEYINDFYAKYNNELENTLNDTKKCFAEIKDVLFLELQKYFDQDYSKEKYACYLSIFNCNPRYLENKLETVKLIWSKQPNAGKFITESLKYLQNILPKLSDVM